MALEAGVRAHESTSPPPDGGPGASWPSISVSHCLGSPRPAPPRPARSGALRTMCVCVDGNSSVAESVGIGPPMPLCTPPGSSQCAHFLLVRRRTNDTSLLARVSTQSSHRGERELGRTVRGRGRERGKETERGEGGKKRV